MPVRYRRLVFGLDGADQDLLTAALWELGTLGIEHRERPAAGSVVAYFAADAEWPALDWGSYGARLLADEAYEERDWLAAYRARVLPLPVGRRLLVDPGEPEPAAGERLERSAARSGRLPLRLPARTAFGTGEHPTTRLVIELLDEMDLEGMRVLDVGAGSGILSFAACLFGAARVVGVEIDPAAALVASQNRRLNGLFPDFVAGEVKALEPGARFDLALVNVLPHLIVGELGALRGLLRPGGEAIFSGIPTESAATVAERVARRGFGPGERRSAGEWTALRAAVAAA